MDGQNGLNVHRRHEMNDLMIDYVHPCPAVTSGLAQSRHPGRAGWWAPWPTSTTSTAPTR
jgi:hypothetical protein